MQRAPAPPPSRDASAIPVGVAWMSPSARPARRPDTPRPRPDQRRSADAAIAPARPRDRGERRAPTAGRTPSDNAAWATAAPAPPAPSSTTRPVSTSGQPADEALLKAGPVGVMPDGASAVEHHRVHGAAAASASGGELDRGARAPPACTGWVMFRPLKPNCCAAAAARRRRRRIGRGRRYRCACRRSSGPAPRPHARGAAD